MNEQDTLYSLLDSGELLAVNGLDDLDNCEGSTSINAIHVCQHCNKVFLKNSNYQTHLRTHTGEKPFVCCICMKQFARADYLKAHLVSHSGARPYTCGICEKTFTHVSSLNTHIRIHTGERPYVCHICTRSFTKSSDLQRHLDVHREKLFTCFMCDRRFARVITLKKHLERCTSCSEDISNSISQKYRGSHLMNDKKIKRRKTRSEDFDGISSDEDYEPFKKKRAQQETQAVKNGDLSPKDDQPEMFLNIISTAPTIPESCNGFLQNAAVLNSFDPTKTAFLIIPGQQNSFLLEGNEELFKSSDSLPLQTLTLDLAPSNSAQQ